MLPEFYSNYGYPLPGEFDYYQPSPIRQTTQMQPAQQPSNFPSNSGISPVSPKNLDTNYTQGFLKTQIGKKMRITFLIGTNTIQDRDGTLEEVGISYVIIKDADAPTSTLCDIYSIKFVTIFPWKLQEYNKIYEGLYP